MSTVSSTRRIAIAASIGTFIDWYDFFLSAVAAAIVWPAVYFRFVSGSAALGLSILTYAVSYFTRPLGALVFGHLGDRGGRKKTVVSTLIIMSIATFGIALTPDYSTIGVAGPVLIIVFRLIFGVGVGGEFGGATSWVVEYASRSKWRGFWNGLIGVANPLGESASALAFSFASAVTGSQFLSWGWRIPFLVGGLGLVFGIVMRYTTEESPLFESARREKNVERSPSLSVLVKFPFRIILLSLVQLTYVGAFIFMLEPYSVAYVTRLGVSPQFVTLAVGVGTGVAALFALLGSVLADVIGRKKIVFVASLLTSIVAFPFFLAVNTLIPVWIFIAYIMFACVNQLGGGPVNVLFPEQFPTRYRYSGSGLCFQFGGLIAGILSGFLLPAIIAIEGPMKAWPYVALTTLIMGIIGAIAVIPLRETKDARLE